MGHNRHSKIIRILELVVILFLFTAHIHLLTSASTGLKDIIISGGIVILSLVFGLSRFTSKSRNRRRVWVILSALAGSFWFFNLFRYAGLVEWPLGHPGGLREYGRLLYFHFVLSIMVLTFLLTACYATKANSLIRWGNWKRVSGFNFGRIFLIVAAIGVWVWAVWTITMRQPRFENNFVLFLSICILKAALTGTTEEICYRGVVQPAAMGHFGVPLGIIIQSCLYTAFHMHLGSVIFPKTVFLMAVMSLGVIFGVVSYRTRGIGWAVLIHTAINMVVEWRNIC